MPSRLAVVSILFFWLITSGVVLYRELRPRYFADSPPEVAIDLSDEATPTLPVQWDIFQGDKKVGSLTTRMTHVPSDDTFRFISNCVNLKFDFQAQGQTLSVGVPSAEIIVRVTRDGRLREQSMVGRMEVKLLDSVLAINAEMKGRVDGETMIRHCRLKCPPFISVDRQLDPIAVPDGQVLNPLMPVNRLKHVYPGRQWSIRAIDPLFDSLRLVLTEGIQEGVKFEQKSALLGGELSSKSPLLLARVLDEQEVIDRPAAVGGPVPCYVIEYRSEEAKAWTWVAVSDGRVMRQKAIQSGIEMRFERRD